MQGVLHHRPWDLDLGHDAMSPDVLIGEDRGLLVSREVALDGPVGGTDGCRLREVRRQPVGGDGHHVLPGGVAGGEIAQQVDQVAVPMNTEVLQPAVMGRLRRSRLQLREGIDGMGDEGARFDQVAEAEERRARDALQDAEGTRTPAAPDGGGSSRVGRHQRPLGGGEGNVEIAVSVQAVDAQRADDAGRHLGHADEVLDVPLEGVRRDDRALPRQHVQRRSSSRKQGQTLGAGRPALPVAGNGRRQRGVARRTRSELRRKAGALRLPANGGKAVTSDRARYRHVLPPVDR
jgi:hypothetical protein